MCPLKAWHMKQTNRKELEFGIPSSEFFLRQWNRWSLVWGAPAHRVAQEEADTFSWGYLEMPRVSVHRNVNVSGSMELIRNHLGLGAQLCKLGSGQHIIPCWSIRPNVQSCFPYCLISGPQIPSLTLGKDLIKKPVDQQKWFHKSAFCYQLCTGKTMMKE